MKYKTKNEQNSEVRCVKMIHDNNDLHNMSVQYILCVLKQ